MRILAFVFTALITVSPASFGAGVHIDEIEYQDLLNTVINPMSNLISALERGKKTFDDLSAVNSGKTTAQLCAQLFPTGACSTAGDAQFDITADLAAAAAAMNQLYRCADNETCATSDRFAAMRKFVQIR